MEDYHLKNLTGEDAKKILECADQEGINVEKIIEFINELKGGKRMSDEKMTEEQFIEKEKKDLEKIEKYIEANPGVNYRDAVLFCVDRRELTPQEKKVEEYIEKCKSQGIEVTYRQAVLAVLDKSEPKPEKEEK